MREGIIRKPVELIDEDLDAVAGGDFNYADIDQSITQVQVAIDNFYVDQDQSAANLAVVSQSNS